MHQTLFGELVGDTAVARGEQTQALGQGRAEGSEPGTSHLPAEGPSGSRPA